MRRRSEVSASEARGRALLTPVSQSVPCDPPACQHHIRPSVREEYRERRAGVGPLPLRGQLPCSLLGSRRNSQSIADSDTGHWTLARLIAVDTLGRHLPAVNTHHARRDTSRLKVRHFLPLQQVTKEVRITQGIQTIYRNILSPPMSCVIL